MIYSFIFLCLIFISFYGYGCAIQRWLLPQHILHFGFTTTIGLAMFLALTGFIELLHLGGTYFFSGYLLFGLSTAVLLSQPISITNRIQQIKPFDILQRHKLWQLILFIILLGCIAAYVINLCYLPFNHHDDYQSYLVFAKRILAEGWQGSDIFNVRGIEQGFGAGSYLNALFSSFSDLKNIKLAEAGIGAILLLLLAVDHIQKLNTQFSKKLIAVLCAFILVLCCPSPVVNISPALTGCTLFYACLIFYNLCDVNYSPKQAVLFGILLAALILLKGNFLVAAGIAGAAFYLARMFTLNIKLVFAEIFITLATLIILLSPWLISNYQFAHTTFYPLLGKGVVHSGSFQINATTALFKARPEYLPFYLLLVGFFIINIFIIKIKNLRFIRFAALLMLLSFFLTQLLAATSAGQLRYLYAMLMVPNLYLLIQTFGEMDSSSLLRQLFSKKIFPLLLCIFMLAYAYNSYKTIIGSGGGIKQIFYAGILSKTNNAKLGQLAIAAPDFYKQETVIKKLQSAIPEKTAFLVRIDTPFLLDFSRNRIFVMDWPGAAGFMPGTPYQGTAEDLAFYLRSHAIRYLAYSYGNQALYSVAEFASRLNDPDYWISNLTRRTFAVQKQLTQLGKTYLRLYDDGNSFVLDLCINKLKKHVVDHTTLCKSSAQKNTKEMNAYERSKD